LFDSSKLSLALKNTDESVLEKKIRPERTNPARETFKNKEDCPLKTPGRKRIIATRQLISDRQTPAVNVIKRLPQKAGNTFPRDGSTWILGTTRWPVLFSMVMVSKRSRLEK
jgi:hypothetical protein